MSSKSMTPGEPDAAPVESRRTTAATDVGHTSPQYTLPQDTATADHEGDVVDLPDLGEFSAESARPTPLDDIAEVEREKAPRD